MVSILQYYFNIALPHVGIGAMNMMTKYYASSETMCACASGLGPRTPLVHNVHKDLSDSCQGVNCQLYADDIVIHLLAKTPALVGQRLTQALHNVSRWLEQSHLTLNVSKTFSMCFSITKWSPNTFEVH